MKITKRESDIVVLALKSAFYWMGKIPSSTEHHFSRDKQRVIDAAALYGLVLSAAGQDMQPVKTSDDSRTIEIEDEVSK